MSKLATRVAMVVIAIAAVTVNAQQEPVARRQRISEGTVSAIDRGLRDQDPPRDPRTRRTASMMRAGGDALPYLRGSIIVKFKDGISRGTSHAITALVAGTVVDRSSWSDFDIVDIPNDADPEAAAAALASRADVEFAQPRYRNHAMVRPNDSLYANQWNFPAIDMERAWDVQPGASAGIVVAVLDVGMAFWTGSIGYDSRFPYRLVPGGPLYPALGRVTVPFAAAPELGASGSSRFVAPRDFIWNDDLPVDLDGHGTHVAGTVGQLTNNGVGTAGMAYNVRLMPVKVITGAWDDIFGSPFEGTDDVVARGIRYAADNGANVLNLSLGREDGGPATVVIDAIRYAVGRGCFVVVASGNSRAEGNSANRLAMPARQIQGMVAVGGVGRTLDLAFYSTTGPFLELVAPGGDQRQGGPAAGILQQTLDSDLIETYLRPVSRYGPPRADSFAYEYYQGTSMATPHVSGFAALLMQQGLRDPAVIEAAMEQFATDKGTPGLDDSYGYGLINPRLALRGLGLAR